MRAGTENVYGIVGFSKALEIAMNDYAKDSVYINTLNLLMRDELKKAIPSLIFNNPSNSLYTVLSVGFPDKDKRNMLVSLFDIKGICVSGGSACSSGDKAGSHVIKALERAGDFATIRFSFCKYNTVAEVLAAVDAAKAIFINAAYAM